jgi:hypothetical protein
VNAEWGAIQVESQPAARMPGEPLRVQHRQRLALELINSGPATWTASATNKPGSVSLSARTSGRREQRVEIKRMGYGDRIWLSWQATDPGLWVLRPRLEGVGGFGEELRIEVVE